MREGVVPPAEPKLREGVLLLEEPMLREEPLVDGRVTLRESLPEGVPKEREPLPEGEPIERGLLPLGCTLLLSREKVRLPPSRPAPFLVRGLLLPRFTLPLLPPLLPP